MTQVPTLIITRSELERTEAQLLEFEESIRVINAKGEEVTTPVVPEPAEAFKDE